MSKGWASDLVSGTPSDSCCFKLCCQSPCLVRSVLLPEFCLSVVIQLRRGAWFWLQCRNDCRSNNVWFAPGTCVRSQDSSSTCGQVADVAHIPARLQYRSLVELSKADGDDQETQVTEATSAMLATACEGNVLDEQDFPVPGPTDVHHQQQEAITLANEAAEAAGTVLSLPIIEA